MLLSSCVSREVVDRLPSPIPVRVPEAAHWAFHVRPEEFGHMVAAYAERIDDKNGLMCEIEFSGNYSSEPKMPSDLRPYLERALNDVGEPVRFYARHSPLVRVDGPGVAAGLATVYGKSEKPPERPQAALLVTASLLRATETFEYENSVEGGILVPKTDARMGVSRKIILKPITVQVSVSLPNGVSLPGATATYKVTAKEDEKNRSLGIFVAGNGITHDRRIANVQDMGEALATVTMAALIEAMGMALQIPYYRLDSYFQPNARLDQYFRYGLVSKSLRDLEDQARWYLWVGSDGSPAFGKFGLDRVKTKMAALGLNPASRADLEGFTYQLWKELDYKKGAPRALDFFAELRRPPTTPANPPVQPAAIGPHTFGWDAKQLTAAGERFVLIDLTRIRPGAERKTLFETVLGCHAAVEAKAPPDIAVVGIRLRRLPATSPQASKMCLDEAHLQYRLVQSTVNPMPVWANEAHQLLILRRRLVAAVVSSKT